MLASWANEDVIAQKQIKMSEKIMVTNLKCNLYSIFVMLFRQIGLKTTQKNNFCLMHLGNIFNVHQTKKLHIILLTGLLLISIAYNSLAVEVYRLKRVAIDAGHGGKDPGAIGSKSNEKDITLAVALKLGKYIEQTFPDVEVIYTRKEDVFVGLDERSKIANDKGADLFISIHCNANPSKAPWGAETYVMGLHKSNENLDVAMRENAVIAYEEDFSTKYEGYDPSSAESFIIFSLIQHSFLEQSLNFASLIQDEFRERAQRKDRGVKQAGFLVLWKTKMPSVLVELGFISHPKEESFLITDSGQDYLASAIFRAFREHKKNVEARSNFITEANINSKDKTAAQTQKPVPAPQPTAKVTTNPSGPAVPNPELSSSNNPTSIFQSNVVQFKVQITSSSKSIPIHSPYFKKLDGIEEVLIGGIYKYFIGSKNTYTEIVDFSIQIKELFPDAFVVAFINGEQIPLDQAKKLSSQ